jgi:hypothetical protein
LTWERLRSKVAANGEATTSGEFKVLLNDYLQDFHLKYGFLATHLTLRISTTPPHAGEPSPKIQVYFSPHGDCTDAIVNAIQKAANSILLQAYSFTSAPHSKSPGGCKETRREGLCDLGQHATRPPVARRPCVNDRSKVANHSDLIAPA